MNKLIIICAFCLIAVLSVFASGIAYYVYIDKMQRNEDPLYWQKDISEIENRYKGKLPQNVVVFIGSSSIRKWKTLSNDMSPLLAVNHGFGGSKVTDSTYYLDRLVFPFNPRAVVFYSGSNDINGIKGSSKSGEDVYLRTVAFFDAVHSRMSSLPIFYISITPNKARWSAWNDAKKANELIREYCVKHKNVYYIDATAAFLDASGNPNEAFFTADKLHFNELGYKTWTSIIKPILMGNLSK